MAFATVDPAGSLARAALATAGGLAYQYVRGFPEDDPINVAVSSVAECVGDTASSVGRSVADSVDRVSETVKSYGPVVSSIVADLAEEAVPFAVGRATRSAVRRAGFGQFSQTAERIARGFTRRLFRRARYSRFRTPSYIARRRGYRRFRPARRFSVPSRFNARPTYRRTLARRPFYRRSYRRLY